MKDIKSKIVNLKNKLRATDYKALKFAEGELTVSEYASTKEERKQYRAQINELERQLAQYK